MFVHYPAEAIQMFENKSPQLYLFSCMSFLTGTTKKEQIFVQYIIKRYLAEYEKRGNIRPTIDLILREYNELKKDIGAYKNKKM